MPLLSLGEIEAFIRANTRLLSPPLVPEIRLYLAEESVPIWLATEAQLDSINLPPPYWAFAWAGGQALARYILDNPKIVTGKTVLDLGAGSGLTAIAAMKSGAANVLAADIDVFALAAVRMNALENGVEVATTSEDLLAAPSGHYDVILVGDLFYEKQLADKVIAFIESAAKSSARILIGDPQRNYFPKGRFSQEATFQVPVTLELEDAKIKNTAVWTL